MSRLSLERSKERTTVSSKHDLERSLTEHSINSSGHSMSNVGDPKIETDSTLKVQATTFPLWGLAVTAVLGGDFYAWNRGFQYGLGPFAVSSVLVTIVFVTLVFSVSELSSALPFSGGSYGFVRATLGKYLGLLAGLAESMGYILSVAATMMTVAQMVTYATNADAKWEILWVLIAYCIAVGLHIAGGSIMWKSMIVLAISQIVVLIVYLFSAFLHGDLMNKCVLPDNVLGSGDTKWWALDYRSVMKTTPYAVWWYLGVEILPFAAEETVDAKRVVPRASLLAMATLIGTGLISFFTGCTVGPDLDTLFNENFPLSIGFDYLFGGPGLDRRSLVLLSIVGTFCSGYGIMFAYGRQMYSMARSGLLPDVFTKTWGDRGTPAASLIICSSIGYVFSVVARLTDYDLVSSVMFSLGMIGSMLTYVSIFVAYIIINYRYYMIPRPFRSALGLPGAIIGLACGVFMLIGMVGWSKYAVHGMVGLVVWFIVGMSYYVFEGRKHTVLSPEEQFALFLIYSIRFVRNKQRDATTKKKYEADDTVERNRARREGRATITHKRANTFTSANKGPGTFTRSQSELVKVHPLGPVRTSTNLSTSDPSQSGAAALAAVQPPTTPSHRGREAFGVSSSAVSTFSNTGTTTEVQVLVKP